eukprot:symbB.v1.2.002727.t1/scaffold146.1/size298692/8
MAKGLDLRGWVSVTLEAAPDRPSALKVIQEVQLRVLPCHGFAISGDEAEVATRITQMQGFLQSGRIDPRVSPALERSVNLSGYNRLLSKVMVAKNKSAASASRALVLAEPSKADPDDYWKHSHRPAKALWIASTWNKFSPQEMKWDGSKYYHNFQVGSNGWESFQLLMDGRWEQCVYPSVPDGCPFVNYELRGPNNKGHGKNWTVGRHPKDPAKNGDRLRITVSVNSQGLPKEPFGSNQLIISQSAMAAFVLAQASSKEPTARPLLTQAKALQPTGLSPTALHGALAGSVVALASALVPRSTRSKPRTRHVRLVRKASTKLDDSGAWSFVQLTNGDSEAKVYLRGANVTSFTVKGVEWIGLRADCKLDGSKANISGGLPICFPQFGPGEVIPQHGQGLDSSSIC